MKEKTKVKLLALAIMLVTMTLMPIGQVKAALQANPNTQYTKTATPENSNIISIRIWKSK